MDNKKTGQFIAACRKNKKYTQRQLAEQLGITNKAISKWETGQGMPDISLLPELGRVLGVSVDELISGEFRPAEQGAGRHPEAPLLVIENEQTQKALVRQQTCIQRYAGAVPQLQFLLVWLCLLATVILFFLTKMLRYSRGGLFFYIALPLEVLLLLLISQAGRIRAFLQYHKSRLKENCEVLVQYCFYPEQLTIHTAAADESYPYTSILTYTECPQGLLLKLPHRFILLEPTDGEQAASAARFLEDRGVKETGAGSAAFYQLRMLGSGFFISLSFLLVMLQAGFLIIGRRYGIEYIYDSSLHWINAAILISAGAGLLLYRHQPKKKILLVTGILAGICIVYITAALLMFPDSSRTFTTGSGTTTLILKQNRETGETGIYRRELQLFARQKDRLPYTMDTDKPKFQWLTDDSCTVTWYSPDDENIHQYVATYGDRGIGPGYYNITSALSERIWTFSGADSSWRFAGTDEGFLVSSGSETLTFTYSDCVQYGTIAMILCENGIPRYTVVLNEDCRVDGGVLLDGPATITLCPVSLDKTALLQFTSDL